MHIAVVSTDPGIPVFGQKGASIHLQEILRAFLSRGARVTLLSPRLDGDPAADLGRVTRLPLPSYAKGLPAELRERALLGNGEHVRTLLSSIGPIDLVYERHALFSHAAMEFANAHGLPSVLEVNAPLLEEQSQYRTLALPGEAASSTRRVMRAASAVYGVTDAVADYAASFGADPSCLHVIGNAVNPHRFPRRAKPRGPFTVGFLGTLKPWHDVVTLIDALAILRASTTPEARLLIVGDGPERQRLEARADALGISSSVEFTGAIAAEQVPDALARMHAAVAPYSAEGPFYFSPLKIYEYMAAELPVVASNVGHLSGVVAHGKTGLLTAPGEARDLAEALSSLAARPEWRDDLGRTARAEVLAEHTWDRVAQCILQIANLPRAAA